MSTIGLLTCSVLISSVTLVAHRSATDDTSGPRQRQAEELPEGEGKRILQASCTACHDLTEITKFKGYYTREDWRDVVRTMVEYGASLKQGEGEVLVEYLAVNLGKR